MADVKIVHDDGRTGTVPATNLAEAEKLGWHRETKDEDVQEHAQALPVAAAQGFGAGIVGGALALPKAVTGLGAAALGVQDPLARFSGHQFMEDAAAVGAHLTGGESEVAARQEKEVLQGDAAVHPWGTLGGELAGNLVGAGALAKVAGVAGGALTRGAAALGLGARGAAFSGGLGATALEGAGLGATAASESAWLKDQTATAEQTLAGMGTGALFGGLLHGASSLIGARGGAKLSEALARTAGEESGGLEGAAARLEGEAPAGSKEAFLRNGLSDVDIPQSGMREESLDYLRKGGEAHGGPPRIGVEPDGTARIIDGRHRITLAREAGQDSIRAKVYGYDADGNVTWQHEGPVPLTPEADSALPHSVLSAPGNGAPAPLAEAANSSTGKRARAWLSGAGDEAMVDAISRGNKPALKALGGGEPPTALRKRETGALLHEMGIGGVGKSEASMLETAEARVSEMGRRIGKAVDAADARVATESEGQLAPKSIEALFPKIEALKTRLAGEGMLAEDRAIPAWLDDQTQWLRHRAATGELMPSDVQKFRIEVDSRLGKWAKAEPGPKGDAARELRRVLETQVEDEVRQAGPDVLKDYQRAKKLYAAANWAADTLGERVEIRNGANRLLSPTDYLAGATAFAHGLGAPMSLVASLGNKVLRERGYSTAAVLAKKLAGESVDVAAAPVAAVGTARNVQALVAHSEQHIADGVGRFLGGGEATAGRAVRRTSTAAALRSTDLGEAQRAYRDHAREVQMVASVPEVASSRLAALTGRDLPAVAPGLNAAMAAVASRGAQYLSANLPAPPTDPDSITPQLDEPPPVSESDLARYADRVEGVENPLSLVDDLHHGKVSPEKTDAVKTVYPVIFERIRASVFVQLAERKTPVPYQQRLLLDLALDGNGTLEPSLRPGALAVMKAANAAVQQSAKQPPASGKVPHVANLFATRTAQLAAPQG